MDDTSKKSEPAVRRVVWGRRFLASTVVVPPDVAEHLNTDAMAVLKQLVSRMDEIADRVAHERTGATRERTSTHEAQRLSH